MISLAPILLGSIGSIPGLATAFGTINDPYVIGQHNEHELITRLAFRCPDGQKSDGYCFEPRSLDQLAGYHQEVAGIQIPVLGFNGAVGAPDTLDPMPEDSEAHCDDADYIDIPGYPQSRADATAKLQECVDHLRARFRQALGSAEDLLDDKKRIRRDMVGLSNLFGGDCFFAFPPLQVNHMGRAKCNVIEGFGRALHGVQDFYSHSNWVDTPDLTRPIGITNPPGLERTDIAPFFDLRTSGPIPEDKIPVNLTTGCFVIADRTPGTGNCEGRVTHNTLHKDYGHIYLNGTFGEIGDSPRAQAVPENFHMAVKLAIQASRDTWSDLREELRHRFGEEKGDLIICSLVRDDPVVDCRHPTSANTLKGDGTWQANMVVEVEKVAVENITATIEDTEPEPVAVVIDLGKSAKVVEDPASATMDVPGTGAESDIKDALSVDIEVVPEEEAETLVDQGQKILAAIK
ncbi:hypothetical protein B0H63DRAFT_463297 [Podospora didyma]|uniref:Uncharacterized protein n=1 Tax=Podospora didyma TaxID=330526 RepID=A0AAE0NWT2_9PEZI|nr:hypothetical protein B0H63DRAFT_463297 [Podospora didyma]